MGIRPMREYKVRWGGGELERDVKRGVSKPNDIHSANIDNDWESIE